MTSTDPGKTISWKRRAITVAVIVVVGAGAGWLAFNLGLDLLLGGRTFH